jgi:hypothetical protein
MADKLELSGTLSNNLKAAIASAQRLRGHAVYGDTLDFWRALLAQARSQERKSPSAEHEEVMSLIAVLQAELSEHE